MSKHSPIGADGDHVDCFLGPHPKSPKAYIIDQVDPDSKKFDEHKIMLGFFSQQQAVNTYTKAFSDGKGKARIGAITEVSIPTLKAWLKHCDTKKAFSPTLFES